MVTRPPRVMVGDGASGYIGCLMSEGVVAVAQRRGGARYRCSVLAVRTLVRLDHEVSTR